MTTAKTLLLATGVFALSWSLPALAQMEGMDHSAHQQQPSPPPPQAPAPATPSAETPMDHGNMDHGSMEGMENSSNDHGMTTDQPLSSAEGSGTARVPGNESAMPGVHVMAGDWMLMAHGTASLQYTDVSGPRGDDKIYATSMMMLMGQRDTSWGRIQLKSMLSLEPAMNARGYPNLFGTGETAGGLPLVDRQHPHDLFMELAARVDFKIGRDTTLFVYGGPVGEPALGPSAFMHRGSARLNPEPPITHHWFDSTHITYGVVTAGISSPHWQLEGSGFRGREPDEHRWNIESPRIDSWSLRATWTPTPEWAAQVSYGKIKQPEALHPGEDEHRTTASVHYDNGKGFAAMAAFSAKDRVPGDTLTAWLAEAIWDLDRHNTLFGRIENVANDELFPNHGDPLHDQEFHVTKFQLGYARRMPVGPFELALGGSVSAFAKPAVLDAAYGKRPIGYTLFARLTLGD